ncbi:MAG: hypothetical protein EHM53_11330 [Methanoregulaceae archaeon]|nr:MAG: hypothetical protein EHM53_11330 [Methanoregulaceae archaeon]
MQADLQCRKRPPQRERPLQRDQDNPAAPGRGNPLRQKPFRDSDVFKNFLKDLSTLAPVTWLNEDYYSRTKVFEKSIKVQTVASSKGLQYRVVFVMWADLFSPRSPSDMDLQKRFLYVALTRASDVLVITYSETNEFIERMESSGDAVGK